MPTSELESTLDRIVKHPGGTIESAVALLGKRPRHYDPPGLSEAIDRHMRQTPSWKPKGKP